MKKEVYYLNYNIYLEFVKNDKDLLNKRTRPYVKLINHNDLLYAIPLRSNPNKENPQLQLEVTGINNDVTYLDFSKTFRVLSENIFNKGNKSIEIKNDYELNEYLTKFFGLNKQNKIKHPIKETKILNIQRNLYLKDYLTYKGLPTNKSKFLCLSKKHNDTIPSMSYNPKNNTIHCFSCGITYDLISLIQEEYNSKYNDAITIIDELITSEFKDSKLDFNETKKIPIHKNRNSKQVIEYISNMHLSFLENKNNLNYIVNRGIDIETAIKQNIGYDEKLNRLIFPTQFPNQSYIYKTLKEGEKKGYFFLKGDQLNLSLNLSMNQTCNIVFLVEGVFDGLSFANENHNYISMNSCNNLKNTFNLIKSLKAINSNLKYCLAMDNDQAGINATNKIIDFFKENAIKYSLFSMHDYNDPNEFYCNDKNKFINELNYHEKLTSLIEREETTMENEKKLDNQSNGEKENIENTYFYKVKKIVDNFSISEEDELKKTRKLKQELSSILDEMKNDKELKTQKEIDQETERILSGTVINVADFNVKDKDNLVSRNFWIESDKGKKYNCQMFVNPNYESKNIKKGDVVSLTGNFKKFKDKEGIEKLTFKVSKLENTSAQVQSKEQEQTQ